MYHEQIIQKVINIQFKEERPSEEVFSFGARGSADEAEDADVCTTGHISTVVLNSEGGGAKSQKYQILCSAALQIDTILTILNIQTLIE